MQKSKNPTPPRFATKLLQWYCKAELLEDLQGDLNEYFHRNLQKRGLRWAQFQYVLDVLKFFRHYLVRTPVRKMNVDLYINYSKTAIRSYNRWRGYTALNVMSLTLGLSTVLLLLLFIYTEWTFDRHVPDGYRIYRVTMEWRSEADNATTELGWSLSALPEQLRFSFPEVEEATGIARCENQVRVNVGGQTFLEDNFFKTDASYFSMFPQRWIQGEVSRASPPSGIVLTETLKKKYFGGSDALGEAVDVNGVTYHVSGVIEDVPYNTTIRYKALLFTMDTHTTDWCFTFLRTHENINSVALGQRLDTLFNEVYGEAMAQSHTRGAYHLEKLNDIHFGEEKAMDPPKSNASVLSVLGALALVVMFISIANYINLTVSHSAARLRESGIRIVMGAQREHTRMQAVIESMWIVLVSIVISTFIVIYAWPLVSRVPLREYALRANDVVSLCVLVAVIFVIVSTITGMIISRKRIASTINQAMSTKGWTNPVLMIAQCILSVCLIFGADVIDKQVRLLTGEVQQTNQVMVIDLPRIVEDESPFTDFQQKVEQFSFIAGTSFVASGAVPTAESVMDIFAIDVPGGQHISTLPYALIDDEFFETLGLEFIAGKEFTTGDSSGAWEEVIVNQAFVKSQGWTDDPLSHSICYGMGCEGNPLVGVVRDFGFQGFNGPEKPMLFYKNHKPAEKLMIRLSQAGGAHIDEIRQLWKTSVNEPFEFHFLDEYYERRLAQEQHIAQQVRLFAWIAVLIAVTGILGMIVTSMYYRKKEMAIRAIFGAQYQDILLISWKKTFGVFVIAICGAWPLAYIVLSRWLMNYTLQTKISLSDYMIAVTTMLVVFATAILCHFILLRRSKSLDAIRYE